MDLERLVALARTKVQTGELPTTNPAKVYSGYGRGYRCSVCDQTIRPVDVEYEFRLPDAVFRFHARCHGVWEVVRREQREDI